MAADWLWASGGIVRTPTEMNDLIRGCVGGELFGSETQSQQTDLFIPGGASGPPGPGLDFASLALFRYQSPAALCTGTPATPPGYTQLMVAGPDGTRSATMAMTLARNADGTPDELQVLDAAAAGRGLRHLPGAGRFLARC